MPQQFDYALTAAAAPLHTSTKAPIMELGRESRVTLSGGAIDACCKQGEVAAKTFFMAMMIDGAEKLWDREIRAQWFPTTGKESSPSGSASSSST